ncbi:hypothetical protein [Serratia ficaria]|uniref:hypothetical protein n=1 Tax=Serratia ficaria TaxID=61651 RepID=UPI0021B7400E|nr:hypothetical protein [Serratia ficaria]
MDKLREEFEEKLSHDYGDDALLKNSDGDYVDWLTADLWEYWKASRASIVVELPELSGDPIRFIGDFRTSKAAAFKRRKARDATINECAEAIRSIGLSIKGEQV